MTLSAPAPLTADDLLNLVDAGTDSALVEKICTLARHSGGWSLGDACENGLSLVPNWLVVLARSSYGKASLLPESLLSQWLIENPGGRWWESTFYRGESVGEAFLRAILEKKTSLPSVLASSALWDSIPPNLIRRVEKRSAHRSTESDVLGWAVENGHVQVAESLLKKGVAWEMAPGVNRANRIRSVAMWDLFLSTGGDPRALVEGWSEHRKSLIPVWERLLGSLRAQNPQEQELRSVILAWVERHAGADLEKKRLADYWARLDRHGTASEMASAVRADKNWPTLRDAQGIPPLFKLIQKNMSAFESLAATSKAKPCLSAVDQRGWSLWHHLLCADAKSSLSARALAREHAQPCPVPGRGLLVSLHQGKGLGQKALWELSAPCEGLTSEDWWAGSEQEQRALAQWLSSKEHYLGSAPPGGGFFSPSHLVRALASVLRQHPPQQPLEPSLAGALLVNDFLVGRVYGFKETDIEGVRVQDRLLEMHPTFSPTPEFLGNLEKALGDGALQRVSELMLNHALPSAPASARPRL